MRKFILFSHTYHIVLFQRQRKYVTLTPSQKRCKTPGQRVDPDQEDDNQRPPSGRPADGLQGFGDHNVAVDGNGQKVDHGCDPEQSPAEGVHLTACVEKHIQAHGIWKQIANE